MPSDPKICKNYHDESAPRDCLGVVDERYTMDFTDVEPGAYIYWCARCGPEAREMDDALTRAICTRGPEFREQLEAEVSAAKARDEGCDAE